MKLVLFFLKLITLPFVFVSYYSISYSGEVILSSFQVGLNEIVLAVTAYHDVAAGEPSTPHQLGTRDAGMH